MENIFMIDYTVNADLPPNSIPWTSSGECNNMHNCAIGGANANKGSLFFSISILLLFSVSV